MSVEFLKISILKSMARRLPEDGSRMTSRIGFIGLGLMGTPIALKMTRMLAIR